MTTTATVNLPPNATFAHRQATIVLIYPRRIQGVLEIRERRARGKKVTVSRYAIREEPLAGDVPDRIFRLTKPRVHDEVEWYYVCLSGESARLHQCECKGFESTGTCKHIQALEKLENSGIIPIPPSGKR